MSNGEAEDPTPGGELPGEPPSKKARTYSGLEHLPDYDLLQARQLLHVLSDAFPEVAKQVMKDKLFCYYFRDGYEWQSKKSSGSGRSSNTIDIRNTGPANLLGTYVSSPVGVAAAAGAGSLAADFIHHYVPSAAIGGLGASALELVGAGLVTSAAMTAMGIDNGISVEGVVMGAGSLLAGRGLLNAVGGSSFIF